MGAFDIACPICGASFTAPIERVYNNHNNHNNNNHNNNHNNNNADTVCKWISDNTASLLWLNDLVAVRKNDIPFFGKYDLYGRVECERYGVNIYCQKDVIGLHLTCWKLLGEPDFNWLQKYHISNGDNKYLSPFKGYENQFYDWESFIREGNNLWAAFDPRSDMGSKNLDRIYKLIAEIKCKYSLHYKIIKF